MQGGEEGSGLNDKRPARDLTNPLGHGDAMQRLQLQRLQDQQIERPSNQSAWVLRATVGLERAALRNQM